MDYETIIILACIVVALGVGFYILWRQYKSDVNRLIEPRLFDREGSDIGPTEKKLRFLLWCQEKECAVEPISDKHARRIIDQASQKTLSAKSYCALDVLLDYSNNKLLPRENVVIYRRIDFVAPDKYYVTHDEWDMDIGGIEDEWITIGIKNYQASGFWFEHLQGEFLLNKSFKVDSYVEILINNEPLERKILVDKEHKFLVLEYGMPLTGKISPIFKDFLAECTSIATRDCNICLWIDMESNFLVKGEIVIWEENRIVSSHVNVYAAYNENIIIEAPVWPDEVYDKKKGILSFDDDYSYIKEKKGELEIVLQTHRPIMHDHHS